MCLYFYIKVDLIMYTLLYPSAVTSFLIPNHLAGSTGSLYRVEFITSSGNMLVSFVRGCENKRWNHKHLTMLV